MAEVVASPIANTAGCGPMAGTNREKRCVIKPICANNPNAMSAESVKNFRSPLSEDPGCGRTDCELTAARGVSPMSRSGRNPIC